MMSRLGRRPSIVERPCFRESVKRPTEAKPMDDTSDTNFPLFLFLSLRSISKLFF
jgi:hypothetical protein